MQDGWKAVWSIPYVSVAFFPSLKQDSIAYCSSSRPDCVFELHQLWQSGFRWVYSISFCSISFKPEIVKIGQSYHKMYSNKILNFQECTTIYNVCTKKAGNLLKVPRTSVAIAHLLKVVSTYVYQRRGLVMTDFQSYKNLNFSDEIKRFLPMCCCQFTTCIPLMDATKTHGEKARWEIHKNTTYCFEQIQEATSHKISV